MAWKRQRTKKEVDIDVCLSDFDEVQLLQALIDAGWVSEHEADLIQKRSSTDGDGIFANGVADELLSASDYLKRGNKQEAIIHLERFLGRDWIGVLQ
jgi:hypothetical protein